MDSAVTFRAATLDDAPSMGRLFVEAWRDEHAGLLPEAVLLARSEAESAANWARSIGEIASGARPGQVIVLAEACGALAGLAVGVREATGWEAGELTLVQTVRSHRRRGIGAGLASQVAARLAALGARRMIVRVLETNAPARRFYEALGATLTEVRRDVEESGVIFPERTYLWPDLSELVH